MFGRRGILLIASIAVATAAFLRFGQPTHEKLAKFEELRPGLFRHSLEVSPLTQIFTLPVATWLLKGGQEHSWILVDSGVGLTTYQKSYRAALKSALGRKDKIKLLLLTHSHTDHTEGLPWLLEEYPEAWLAFHEKEAPYVSGGASYAELDGESWIWNVTKAYHNINSSMPVERCITLKGRHGDVAKEIAEAIPDASSWLPEGFLEYLHTPGHAIGHTAFIHKPTSSVIAGDVFGYRAPAWSFKKPKPGPGFSPPVFLSTLNSTLARESAKLVASLPGIETVFPSHDNQAGASVAELRLWTAGFTHDSW
ncbi:hypothetical protein WJX84_002105 [Apatococcus fuscideae]|uniref:Metallo-beta-lactamase domain-containing protein n=1 Tax=Apatococcus fuscideae TaxID=2026836 RepID=A0AAW1TCE2_9CHLO